MSPDPTWLGAIATGGAIAKWLLRHRQGDIPVCNTRIVREGTGLPWNQQIAIHPMEDGSIEMKAVRADKSED